MPARAHSEKTCFKCNVKKPLSDFYKHPMMADGHLNKCKECAKTDVKANRLKRIDYYKAFDAARSNLPHRVEARRQYALTERCKESQRLSRIRYQERMPDRRAAHVLLGNAVRSGVVAKPKNCEWCGSQGKLHGHHEDYTKPLDVIWLCVPCHKKHHRKGEP